MTDLIFWAVAGVLLLAIVLAVLTPLIRRRVRQSDRAGHGLAVLRDQLAEIDRDLTAGRLDAEQAAAARLEVERRILALAGDGDDEPAAERPRASKALRLSAAVLIIILMPAATLGIYLMQGSPGLPDFPLADRAAERARMAEVEQREQGLREMASSLTERLSREPGDLQGWMLLGRTRLMLNQPREAATAFGEAAQLPAADGEVWSSYGEAITMANDGLITVDARSAFIRANQMMPGEPRSRFYLGLAERQEGDVEDALDWWLPLEADTPPDAPWRSVLSTRIEEAAAAAEIDLDDRRAAALSDSEARQPAPRGPTAEQMEAAQDMAPEDRVAMIESMVEGLAARLEEDPSDVQGWQRLGRSYQVLGESEKSAEAYRQAATRAPDNLEAQLDYAHALFPPGTAERDMPQAFIDTIDRIRRLDPAHPEGLFFGGLIAARRGADAEARDLWSRLLDSLPADSPVRGAVERRIEALDG